MMAAPTTLEEALRLLEELDRQIRERDLQIRELDLRIKERDQQLEDPRRLLRPTTLDEYLEECHNLVYSRFSVGPDQTTTGSIHAYEKFVPKALRRWTDFLGRQNEMMTAIYSSFPTDEPLFDHRAYLSTVGKKVAPIADEKMLEAFLRTSVEDPVRCIMNELSKSDDFLKEMDIGRGIKFGNHLKAVAEYGFEVAKEHPQQPSASPPRLPSHSEFDRLKTPDVVEDPPRLNADQICTYRYERGDAVQRSLLAISKYKPPHKLTINQLRVGLHDMDIFQDVVRQVKRKRPDDEKDFQEDAERVTAAAVVQTYHYMIKAGLSYSLLTTGEAVVFLKIDWGQPETLYYHLAEPGAEVAEHSQYRSCTAVAQYVAFHLLALRDYPKVQVRQERRLEVARQLKRWSVSFRAAADGATGSDEAPSSSPAFIPKTYSDADRTVRPRKSLRLNPGLATCKDPGTWPGNRSPEGSDDENGPRAQSPTPGKRPGTREPSSRKSRQHTGATGSNPQSGHAGRGTSRYSGKSIDEPQPPPVDLEYCTQRCLLSMVKARSADPHCPNVSLHTEGQGPDEEGKVKHAISHYEFQKLLSDQLAASLDDGIKPLNASGARGVMLKVTLLPHG